MLQAIMTYRCCTCRRTFKFLKEYNCHQRFHKHLPNVVFICLEKKCGRKFKKYINFYMHNYRCHLVRNEPDNKATQCYNCGIKLISKSDLSSHVATHIRNGDHVKCPLEKCHNLDIIFRNVSTWRSHLYRKHRELKIPNMTTANHDIGDNFDLDLTVVDQNRDQHTRVDDGDIEDVVVVEKDCYLKSLSLLYLTLNTKFFVTEKALDTIIEGVKDLTELSNKAVINHISAKYNINIADDMYEKLHYFNEAHERFTGDLRTPFIRKKFFKENFKFVCPKRMNLGSDKNKCCSFYYVPILDTLSVLLENNHVQRQWLSKNVSDNNIFSNITDGNALKKIHFLLIILTHFDF